MFDQAGVGIAAGTTNDSVRGDEFQSSSSLVLALAWRLERGEENSRVRVVVVGNRCSYTRGNDTNVSLESYTANVHECMYVRLLY